MTQQLANSYGAYKFLQLLVNARWVYIAGQIVTLAFTFSVLGTRLFLIGLIPLIIIEIIFNLSTKRYISQNKSLSTHWIWYQLLFDLFSIAILLYFTGGATNAFISAMLIPVTLSALICKPRHARITSLIAIGLYSVLMYEYQPLITSEHAHHIGSKEMQWHFLGMWFTFVISTLLIVFFITRLSKTINHQWKMLVDANEKQLRQEHILDLAIQSANAAHHLSTPLNSIQLIVEELESSIVDKNSLSLLKSELEHCKTILHSIRSEAEESPKQRQVSVNTLLNELSDYWIIRHPEHPLRITKEHREFCVIHFQRSLMVSLLNLLDNAARFNKIAGVDRTEVYSRSDEKFWILSIKNTYLDGNLQLPEELGTEPVSSKHGLGLGYLLANTTINSMSGQVELTQLEDNIWTRIQLPLYKAPV